MAIGRQRVELTLFQLPGKSKMVSPHPDNWQTALQQNCRPICSRFQQYRPQKNPIDNFRRLGAGLYPDSGRHCIPSFALHFWFLIDYVSPVIGRMAFFALNTPRFKVDIIASMTADALDGEFNLFLDRLRMAPFAFGLGMALNQLETRAYIVIEHPIFPAGGAMALIAARAKLFLVPIVFFMAGNASRLGILECRRCMTFLAFQRSVLVPQRKFGLVVVE
jgi:hypothetical protein